MPMHIVPPHSLQTALDHLRCGGELVVVTYTRVIKMNRQCLERFEQTGEWLLKEEGKGYRLRSGKSSVYLFPGQLKMC